jgi:hypothetical protein
MVKDKECGEDCGGGMNLFYSKRKEFYMAIKRMTPSQFKSKMRQIESQYNQQIRKINNEIDKYNRSVRRAVDDYDRAVREHNANVRNSRARIQLAIRKLKSSHTSVTTRTNFNISIQSLYSSYENIAQYYDYNDYNSQFEEQLHSRIEKEAANGLETANVIIDNVQPDSEDYSLQDSKIFNSLSLISQDLDDRWRGALFSLNPVNPDATRHFCTSAREIFTEILETKAPDKEVFSVFPTCAKTERGNALRRDKIRFLLKRKGISNSTVTEFVDTDINNIIELFKELNSGTHGKSGKYSHQQLISIKKRVEEGLIFLCGIAS